MPKIVCPPRAARTVLRAPQMAEQLVDVPTVVSYSSLQQLYCRADRRHSCSGSCRRGGASRSSRSTPRTEFSSVLTSSKPLTFQFRAVEVFKALVQDRVQQPSSYRSGIADEAGQGFFALFPEGKKCGVRSALGVGNKCGPLIHPR